MSTTIAAVSTPRAAGGISVIRISGDDARAVADRVFRASGAALSEAEGYTAHYGRVYDGGELIDEAVATVFAAPHSYTGEDVVELSCHGGLFVTERLLEALLKNGAVGAQPGEFTKRAFLNGKLSLTEAESVMDIIGAQNQKAARAALSAKGGALDREINRILDILLGAAANFSAYVDYPDDDIPDLEPTALKRILEGAREDMRRLLSSFDRGRVMREGVTAAIVGRPNVGKSTVMNLLSGYERSIVTEVAGTTRDIVEETVKLGGVVLRLADTAGIRQSDDVVESIGVERARERIRSSELVLAVFDGSEPLTDADRALIDELDGRAAVAIVNKDDLPPAIDRRYIEERVAKTVCVSARTGRGVEEIEQAINSLSGVAELDPCAAMLATARQRDCAIRCESALAAALDTLDSGYTADAVFVEVDEAISALSELCGKKVTDAVTDEVFARFCVGK